MNPPYILEIRKGEKTILTRVLSLDRAAATVLALLETDDMLIPPPAGKVELMGETEVMPKVRKKWTRRVKVEMKHVDKVTRQRHCKNCGKAGHRADGCPTVSADPDEEAAASTPEEAINDMRGKGFKPITPDQLNKVKDMLKGGCDAQEIAGETGLDVDRVEKMAKQLGY